MNIDHLRYFLVLTQEMHYGRAAQRLNISQSGLSHAMAALEQELARGRRLLDEQLRIIQAVDPAVKSLADLRTQPEFSHFDKLVKSGMTISDARSLITSHIDESVDLIVERNGSPVDYTVDCRLIYDDPVSYEMINGNVGYIRIANFESGAAQSSISAIESLLTAGAEYFVFDVRTNPGGLLSELTTLLDYLLPGVDIFVSVDKSGEETVVTSNNVCLDMDMCVLVNADSYSAAEFFAAALQEYGWATIVGEHTTGKGRSQQTFELSDGSALHLSTAKYLTPKRVDLSEQGGVAPDIEVALSGNTDSQLDAAVSQLLYG